jgi:hypothetical protein
MQPRYVELQLRLFMGRRHSNTTSPLGSGMQLRPGKRKSRTLKEKLGRTLRILDATLAVLHVGGIETGHR